MVLQVRILILIFFLKVSDILGNRNDHIGPKLYPIGCLLYDYLQGDNFLAKKKKLNKKVRYLGRLMLFQWK